MNRNVTPASCNSRTRSNGRLISSPSSCAVGSSSTMKRAPQDSARDLDQLARLGPEVAGARVLRYADAPALEQLAGLPTQRAPVNHAPRHRLAVDEQIFRHRQNRG
jgi:hypothetical protein